MGLIDFLKSAGKKLHIIHNDAPAAAPAAPGGPTPQQVQELNDRKHEVALVKLIAEMGFKIDDLGVNVVGEKVTLTGTADTQATREKTVLMVGNVDGIGQVDDQLKVANPEPEATYYEVVKGDTLSKIAAHHYGNANKYPVIFEANRPMLKDPDEIYPGQKLRIPPLPK
ncbi:MAG TPA: peptidoglycan-binding protein LysM [Thermoanaerobaculia bacterium]|jgi:nucleoid-associated protein YgaU|nr:peptidoglycan-binding protein LysM [Thermoanaerobaculia bacterium]